MKFKAILLDVDGVLVDSEKVFNLCWRKAAEQEGYAMTYEQALQLRSLDSQLAKKLFMEWYGDKKAYPSIRTARKSIMSELISKEPLVAKPGVFEFLDAIKELPVKIAIVTSSPMSRITSYLASVGIDIRVFSDIITTEKVVRGKPFPDVYEYAYRAINLKPEECIAVEDSPNGVIAAHTAGFYTAMVPDLSPMAEDMTKWVDVVVERLDNILGLFI